MVVPPSILIVTSNVSGKPTEIKWDGKNENGELITPGVYFGVLESGGNFEISKFIVIK